MTQGVFSIETLNELLRQSRDTILERKERSYMGAILGSPFGMPVRSSGMFPFTMDCTKCGGTGEGGTSTYCQSCKGGGRVTTEGVITNGEGINATATVIVKYHPHKFEPSFPFALPVLPWPGMCEVTHEGEFNRDVCKYCKRTGLELMERPQPCL